MDNEFITIGEAAQLLKQADSVVMRLIKEALLAGVEKEDIIKAEMRQGRMMYLVSRTFLVEEGKKEKEIPFKKESVQEYHHEEKEQSSDLLLAKDDMITTLQKVIDTKDHQIEDLSGKIDQLIERDHETNILMKGLQDQLFLLEEGNPTKGKKGKKK